MTTELADYLRRIGPAGDFPPFLIILDQECFVIVRSIQRKVAPPETILMQYPRQGTSGTTEILEGGQLHGVSIQHLDFTALWLKGII